jgi:hypothetical protein
MVWGVYLGVYVTQYNIMRDIVIYCNKYWTHMDTEKRKQQRLKSYYKNYEANREKILIRAKQYRDNNRDKINAYHRNRKKNDPDYKMRELLRHRMLRVLKEQKSIKSCNTMELLGGTLEQAKAHIESQFKEGMTWANHGNNGWHIDHIIPCASFDLTDPEEQKKCFHYKNLQPLWWRENLLKGANVTQYNINKYTTKDPHSFE